MDGCSTQASIDSVGLQDPTLSSSVECGRVGEVKGEKRGPTRSWQRIVAGRRGGYWDVGVQDPTSKWKLSFYCVSTVTEILLVIVDNTGCQD
jgi:hypothetical protein